MLAELLLITDPKILAIPIIENHEPLVDVKDADDLLYGPPPECELTAPHYTKMRKTVLEKLLAAQKLLPKGWRFRLYEGFRSLEVQAMLFEDRFKLVQAEFPDYNHEQLFYETTRLVSPTINIDGSINVPPHNTGAAIDIEILDHKGNLIDMGMAAKDWLHVDPALCQTNCDNLTPTVQKNRQLLYDLMIDQGFVNYHTEWWHYSYGDRYWAYYQAKNHAIYGSI